MTTKYKLINVVPGQHPSPTTKALTFEEVMKRTYLTVRELWRYLNLDGNLSASEVALYAESEGIMGLTVETEDFVVLVEDIRSFMGLDGIWTSRPKLFAVCTLHRNLHWAEHDKQQAQSPLWTLDARHGICCSDAGIHRK